MYILFASLSPRELKRPSVYECIQKNAVGIYPRFSLVTVVISCVDREQVLAIYATYHLSCTFIVIIGICSWLL